MCVLVCVCVLLQAGGHRLLVHMEEAYIRGRGTHSSSEIGWNITRSLTETSTKTHTHKLMHERTNTQVEHDSASKTNFSAV